MLGCVVGGEGGVATEIPVGLSIGSESSDPSGILIVPAESHREGVFLFRSVALAETLYLVTQRENGVSPSGACLVWKGRCFSRRHSDCVFPQYSSSVPHTGWCKNYIVSCKTLCIQ